MLPESIWQTLNLKKGTPLPVSPFVQERKPSEERVEDQKAVDEQIIPEISKVPNLKKYMKSLFSLRKGQYPHLMKF